MDRSLSISKETLVHNIEVHVHEEDSHVHEQGSHVHEQRRPVAEAVVLERRDVIGQLNPVFEDGAIKEELENNRVRQHGAPPVRTGAGRVTRPDGVVLSVQNLPVEGSTAVQVSKKDGEESQEVRAGIRKTLWYLCSGFGCCIPVWIAKGVKESREAKVAKKEGNLTTYQELKNKVQYRWMVAVIPLVIFIPIIIIVLVTRFA